MSNAISLYDIKILHGYDRVCADCESFHCYRYGGKVKEGCRNPDGRYNNPNGHCGYYKYDRRLK
jgi:hypothetical protein